MKIWRCSSKRKGNNPIIAIILTGQTPSPLSSISNSLSMWEVIAWLKLSIEFCPASYNSAYAGTSRRVSHHSAMPHSLALCQGLQLTPPQPPPNLTSIHISLQSEPGQATHCLELHSNSLWYLHISHADWCCVDSALSWRYRKEKSCKSQALCFSPGSSCFRFSLSCPRGDSRTVCVCVCVLRWRACLLRHPRRLYAPWKGICSGSSPAFPGGGVMPLMPHPTVSDGVERRIWVRPRHDGNVKRRGRESPISPTQLSRIWNVKFSPPLCRRRAGLNQDSADCGEASAWETTLQAKRKTQGGSDGGRRLIRTDTFGGAAVGCKRPMEETKEKGGTELERRWRRWKVCRHLCRWCSFRFPLGLC